MQHLEGSSGRPLQVHRQIITSRQCPPAPGAQPEVSPVRAAIPISTCHPKNRSSERTLGGSQPGDRALSSRWTSPCGTADTPLETCPRAAPHSRSGRGAHHSCAHQPCNGDLSSVRLLCDSRPWCRLGVPNLQANDPTARGDCQRLPIPAARCVATGPDPAHRRHGRAPEPHRR